MYGPLLYLRHHEHPLLSSSISTATATASGCILHTHQRRKTPSARHQHEGEPFSRIISTFSVSCLKSFFYRMPARQAGDVLALPTRIRGLLLPRSELQGLSPMPVWIKRGGGLLVKNWAVDLHVSCTASRVPTHAPQRRSRAARAPRRRSDGPTPPAAPRADFPRGGSGSCPGAPNSSSRRSC